MYSSGTLMKIMRITYRILWKGICNKISVASKICVEIFFIADGSKLVDKSRCVLWWLCFVVCEWLDEGIAQIELLVSMCIILFVNRLAPARYRGTKDDGGGHGGYTP